MASINTIPRKASLVKEVKQDYVQRKRLQVSTGGRKEKITASSWKAVRNSHKRRVGVEKSLSYLNRHPDADRE